MALSALKKNSLHKTVLVALIALCLFSAGSVSVRFAQSVSNPAGIVYSVPVTLTNSQSVATSSPFQQEIIVDSASYAPYETPNLQNIEFFDASGSLIPSWLQSGNSNGATNTVYWLKLSSGIPASSSVTVYMGFASLSTTLFNAQTTGEAPQLSPAYGQYDDGADVFPFYDNFAGTTLSAQWSVNLGSGNYQVNNGLTINYANQGPGYVLSSSTFGPGTAFDAAVTSIGDVCNVGYFNLQESLPTQPGGPGYAGAFIRLAGGKTYPDQWNTINGESNSVGNVFGSLANSEGIPGVYTVEVLSPTSSIQYLDDSIGTSTQPLTTNYPDYPASVGFDSANNGINVQWSRVRALPPNNIMPTVTMPAAQQTYQAVFTESGLLLGTHWSVTLNEQTQSSTTNSVIFNVFNGTYDFSISSPAGYTIPIAQESGALTVNGANVTQTLSFNLTGGTDFIYPPQNFPTSIRYQTYTNVNAAQNFIQNTPAGPTAISIGAMNGAVAVEVSQNEQTLLSTNITGESSNYIVVNRSNSYSYINFISDGLSVTLSFSPISGSPLIAFNFYNNYITNATASLITYPPQFAANFGPTSTPVNTGLSFLLVAPTYAQPTPLAIWVGEGYSNSQTGQEWWAQIGFNNWAGSMNVSYAGWGIFSNIFGNPGGTDYNYPLIPGDTYNFTMALVSDTTWEFVVNDTLIPEPNLSGLFNTTTTTCNEGADLGLETLTAWGGNVAITNIISIPMVMSFQVNGQWSEPSSFQFGSIGENWNNGEATSAPGIDLWGIAGNLQDSSIPDGALLFNDSLPTILDSPNLSYEPIYGDFASGKVHLQAAQRLPRQLPP